MRSYQLLLPILAIGAAAQSTSSGAATILTFQMSQASVASSTIASSSASVTDVSSSDSASATATDVSATDVSATVTDAGSSTASASATASAVVCPASLPSVYETPEGDDYAVTFPDTSNLVSVLATSNQTSACDCAEQCSLFNEATPAPPLTCASIEYIPSDAVANCFVKST